MIASSSAATWIALLSEIPTPIPMLRTIFSSRGTGNFRVAADHTATFNSRVKAVAGGLFAGAGASIDNSVLSHVEAKTGDGVTVDARDIEMTAVNRIRKPWLDGSNISGAAGALIAGAEASSTTLLDLNTLVTVGDNSYLTVLGDIIPHVLITQTL